MKETETKVKLSVLNCPRCELVNTIENKYCSKCSYPLNPEAYDEIKIAEDKKLKILEEKLEEKHSQDIQSIRQEMNIQFIQIINMIQQNPNLRYIKPEVLSQKI